MGHSTVQETFPDDPPVTERELRESGIPAPGHLGAAKKEGIALLLGLVVLVLIVAAIVIETAR